MTQLMDPFPIDQSEASYTQEELSMRADIQRTQVGLLETGKRMLRLDTLLRVGGPRSCLKA